MKERALAEKLIYSAQNSGNNIDPDYRGAWFEFAKYFGKNEYNFRLFLEELDNLGYEVVTVDCTPYVAMSPLCTGGFLIVQERRAR